MRLILRLAWNSTLRKVTLLVLSILLQLTKTSMTAMVYVHDPEYSPVSGRPFHTKRALQKMQMKHRQQVRELPVCLQKTSAPYLTNIHASSNNIRLSEPQRIVWSICQSVFTHKFTYPIGRGKKRAGCVFSRLSHVQGPVENHA